MELAYKSTLKNRLSHFYQVYMFLIAMVLFALFMMFTFVTEHLMNYFYIGGGIYGLFFVLPTCFLHLSYLIRNLNDKMLISFEKEIINYMHKGENTLFHFDDINQIDEYITPALLRKKPGYFPWDTYHYLKITLKNSQEIVITCFMVNELKLPVNYDKIKSHIVFYPFIR